VLAYIFNALIVAVRGAERAKSVSMHSWRVYLACALLSQGASFATIQAMLRWRSEDALLKQGFSSQAPACHQPSGMDGNQRAVFASRCAGALLDLQSTLPLTSGDVGERIIPLL
jgi:hypothetical protein